MTGTRTRGPADATKGQEDADNPRSSPNKTTRGLMSHRHAREARRVIPHSCRSDSNVRQRPIRMLEELHRRVENAETHTKPTRTRLEDLQPRELSEHELEFITGGLPPAGMTWSAGWFDDCGC
jgi:hypothetical protein